MTTLNILERCKQCCLKCKAAGIGRAELFYCPKYQHKERLKNLKNAVPPKKDPG